MRTYQAPPSTGSRMPRFKTVAGTVVHKVPGKVDKTLNVNYKVVNNAKPTWSKPTFTLESNPLKLTGDSRGFRFNALGPADNDALSPYRKTRATAREAAQIAERRKLDRYAHKVGKAVAKQRPKLVKIA